MKDDLLRELPEPPDSFSEHAIEIWYEIGLKILKNRKLKSSTLNLLSELCFWEDQKHSVKENLHGRFTSHQIAISAGNTGAVNSSILLANYKAIQDEINELRTFFGLKPELPEYISNTPEIPEAVYENLPVALQNCCNLIEDKQAKDSFLVMALPVLSLHIPGVLIEHAEGTYQANLFTFVANSGNNIDRHTRKAVDLMSVLNLNAMQGKGPVTEPLISLKQNSKKAKNQILKNKGRGLFFEAHMKASVVSTFFDESLFSDLIEKSVNQKHINISAESGQAFVLKPAISGAFNGALNEVKTMAGNLGEEHLTNYSFFLQETKDKWQSHRPTENTKLLNEEIERFSEKLYALYSTLSKKKTSLSIQYSDSQWQSIDETFSEKMRLIDDLELSHTLQAANHKTAVVALKLAAIFAAIRVFEDEGHKLGALDELMPNDGDVAAALWLTDTFMKHAIRLYQNLPVMQKENFRGDRFNRFYGTLPVIFDTADALTIAGKLSIPPRTATRYLSDLSEKNRLKKMRRGVYKKI